MRVTRSFPLTPMLATALASTLLATLGIAPSALAGGQGGSLVLLGMNGLYPSAASADGRVVAGYNVNEFWYWTSEQGLTPIGGISPSAGGAGSAGISDDGVRVGYTVSTRRPARPREPSTTSRLASRPASGTSGSAAISPPRAAGKRRATAPRWSDLAGTTSAAHARTGTRRRVASSTSARRCPGCPRARTPATRMATWCRVGRIHSRGSVRARCGGTVCRS